MFYPLSIILTFALWLSGPAEQRRVIVLNWNESVESINRENVLMKELQESYQRYPPWIVVSEPATVRRKELIGQIEREHRMRLGNYEALKRAE